MRPKANPGTDGGGGDGGRRPRRTAWCASILLVVTTLVALNTVGVILRSAPERETTDQTYRRQMMARFNRGDPFRQNSTTRRREQDGGLARTHANDNSHNSVPLNQRDATLSPDGGRLGRVWDASGSAAAAALSPVLCETEKRAISPGTEVRVATVSVPLPSSREGETKTFRIATYGKHDIVSGSILTNGNWEPQTADHIKTALAEKEGSVFIDIGANIGYFGLYMATLGYNVIAVEASQENVNLIRYSLCMNPELKSKIKLHHVALADKRMRCTMASPEGNSGNMNMDCKEEESRALDFSGWVHWSGRRQREEVVMTVPLDEVVGKDERVDVLKIDTEGFEYHALVGGQKHVLSKVRYMQSEFSPFMLRKQHSDPVEYLELLRKHGLQVHYQGDIVRDFGKLVGSIARDSIVDITASRRASTSLKVAPPKLELKLLYENHVIAGANVKVGVREAGHTNLIRGHIEREENVYQLTAHAIEEGWSKLVVDAGSNHGAVAAFAALQGAMVEAVEMQEELSRVVSENARANGVNVKVINAAISSSVGTVSYSGHQIAEGAIAQLAPPSQDAPTVASITLDDLIGSRHVAMLKIDVEGADLLALSSADASFAAHRVDHSVVEFGPPSRWTAVTGQSAADGVSVMTKIRNHGYHVRVIRSFAWDAARGMISDNTIREATRFNVQYLELVNEADDEQLVRAMSTCNCESYLWFARRNQ